MSTARPPRIAYLVVPLMLFVVAGPEVPAYERSVHEELTRYLAVSAGLSDAAVKDIAREDQGTDSGSTGPYASVTARRLYHFVTVPRLADMRGEARSSCTVRSIGQYFHALEDSYSHEGYEPRLGHFPDPRPDWTYTNPDRADLMAQMKLAELASLRGACPGLVGTSQPRLWSEIRDTVRPFLRQETPGTLPAR